MITMDWGNTRFQFRAAALIWSNGHLLIHRDKKVDFWVLPGGRVEFNELATEALAREMQEELNSPAVVGPLRYVIELCGKSDNDTLHEIGLYFDVELQSPPAFDENKVVHTCQDGGANLEYRWVRPASESLQKYNFRPSFLIGKLDQRPGAITHIAVHE
ncbi:NUDIX hydrolase [Advenella sp. S44]|uniref:NUDIX hydrolase n=1 Tax=Advenella sp. S44 TaxID=1982755 RepID=UPI0013747995|nr:NUDIX domain-containing protein [Advenella sp. S44]